MKNKTLKFLLAIKKVIDSIFNRAFRYLDPTAEVVYLVEQHLLSCPTDYSRIIWAIKYLRQPEISKYLISAGLVPASDIGIDHIGEQYVGLKFTKEWVEKNVPEFERYSRR